MSSLFCGLAGRDKNNNKCKPSTSPITVKNDDNKKSSSGVRVSPISFDKTYDKAVKKIDVKSKSEELADELGLLRVGKKPGKARELPSYKPKNTKKAGKRRRRKTRRRKSKKRRRKRTRRKRTRRKRRKKRKTRRKRRKN